MLAPHVGPTKTEGKLHLTLWRSTCEIAQNMHVTASISHVGQNTCWSQVNVPEISCRCNVSSFTIFYYVAMSRASQDLTRSFASFVKIALWVGEVRRRLGIVPGGTFPFLTLRNFVARTHD